MTSRSRKRGMTAGAAVAGAYVAGTIVAKKMGYSFGRDTIVRCRAGHVFTTVWIPGATLKALKLGFWRLQWCPAGRHVTLVTPVRDADLTDELRRMAASCHDTPIP